MSRSIAALVSIVQILAAASLDAASPATRPVPNAFYVLENGVADEKHPTPESQAWMVKELGLDGISYNGLDNVAERLAALDKHGLKLFTLYVQAWLDGEEPKYDPRLLDAIKQLKGRETMIWLTIQSTKLKPSAEDGDARAVEILRELADAAAKSQLRIALYPHTWFWLERVEDAVRVARKVDRPNVGVTFNLCHWLKVDKPDTLEARLRLARPYLFQVTINGADPPGDWDKLIQPLDRGSFDVHRVLKLLKDLDYTGPIGLQCYAVKGDKYENLKRSMAVWRDFQARLKRETKQAASAACAADTGGSPWQGRGRRHGQIPA
jgi:sugar phosphate isomerase/epimerase